MFNNLSGYLEALVTPEQRAMCLDACMTLVEAGVTDHEFLIDQELAVADQMDADILQGVVYGLLRPLYDNILAQFGVRLSPEASLAQATDVLKGLNQIDNYADSATLRDLCDSNDGAEAALADILELLGQYHNSEYLTFIAYVSPSLIDRIVSVCDGEGYEPLPDVSIVERSRVRLRKLLESAGSQVSPEPLVLQAVEDGARLGISLDLLIAPYRATLETFGVQQFALEVTAFALASYAEDEVLHAVISRELDHYPLDVSKVTPIDVAITKLLSQVLHA